MNTSLHNKQLHNEHFTSLNVHCTYEHVLQCKQEQIRSQRRPAGHWSKLWLVHWFIGIYWRKKKKNVGSSFKLAVNLNIPVLKPQVRASVPILSGPEDRHRSRNLVPYTLTGCDCRATCSSGVIPSTLTGWGYGGRTRDNAFLEISRRRVRFGGQRVKIYWYYIMRK